MKLGFALPIVGSGRVARYHYGARVGLAQRGAYNNASVIHGGGIGVLGCQPVLGQNHAASRPCGQVRRPVLSLRG